VESIEKIHTKLLTRGNKKVFRFVFVSEDLREQVQVTMDVLEIGFLKRETDEKDFLKLKFTDVYVFPDIVLQDKIMYLRQYKALDRIDNRLLDYRLDSNLVNVKY
jgi:hypothetical protein